MWPGLVLIIYTHTYIYISKNLICTMEFLFFLTGTSLAVQDKINKTQMIELLREGLYGKVDSVQWSPLVKEWVVDGYLQVPTTILRMNHVLNLITKAVKKTELVQQAKEKALKVIEIILKLSMKKAGSMINKLRYKIIVHFQDKGVPIVSISLNSLSVITMLQI